MKFTRHPKELFELFFTEMFQHSGIDQIGREIFRVLNEKQLDVNKKRKRSNCEPGRVLNRATIRWKPTYDQVVRCKDI